MSIDQGEIWIEATEGLTAGGFLGEASLTPANEILPGLWMGGCPQPAIPLPDDFGFVLSLYPWGRWKIARDTSRLEVRLYDGHEVPDEKLLGALATIVNYERLEHKVLVHCQAGLNRSGLIVALALIRQGMKADDAISLLRAKRSPHVLCNQVFARWLRGVPADVD